METIRFSLLAALFLTLSLCALAFALPMSYTYAVTCTKCEGNRKVRCEDCYGSGECWVCDGTGHIWYMPPESDWCAACSGSGRCHTCGGLGYYACRVCGGSGSLTYWEYTSTGSTIVLSILMAFVFLAGFFLSGISSAFSLSFNEWVYDVEDMDFWFNRSFMTWLFAKDRKRWAKWQTCANLIFAVSFGVLLFWSLFRRNLTGGSFFVGISLAVPVTLLFSFAFYKEYTLRLETAGQ